MGLAEGAPAIALRGVSKSFDGGATRAVADLNLVVARGAFLAIVGGSGSGKTTTLKMINGLITPGAGVVEIDGRDVRGEPGPSLRRRIGYAFQGVGLFPHLTIAENIAVTPKLLGWAPAAIAARVGELLDLVGLPAAEYGQRPPAALSGGQRQRVGLARALAGKPSLMLLDEPFGALDPITRDGLSQAYREIHDRLRLTTVMITHDVQEALLMADRLAVMDEGRLIAEGPPEALATSDVAYVQNLLAMPRRQARRVRERLDGAAGA